MTLAQRIKARLDRATVRMAWFDGDVWSVLPESSAVNIVTDECAAYQAKVDALVAALRWYATPGHYVSHSVYMGGGHGPTTADTDGGQRARTALAALDKEEAPDAR